MQNHFLCLCAALCFAAGCNDDDKNSSDATISNSDAAIFEDALVAVDASVTDSSVADAEITQDAIVAPEDAGEAADSEVKDAEILPEDAEIIQDSSVSDAEVDAEITDAELDAEIADAELDAEIADAEVDAEIADAEVDAGVESEQCARYRAMDSDTLVTFLHQKMFNEYTPIQPEPNQGGNLDRYTTARRIMYQQSWYQSEEHPSGGTNCFYTDTFYTYDYDIEPDDSSMNCEHVWPRANMSRPKQDAPYKHQQADLHMIRPTGAKPNSYRGSFDFGNVGCATSPSEILPAQLGCSAATVTGAYTSCSCNGSQIFEPMDASKGDVARIMFYFSVRWGLDLPLGEENTLREWAANDPVSQSEIDYNLKIAELQGYTNPFIDCPGLENHIEDFKSFETLYDNENYGGLDNP